AAVNALVDYVRRGLRSLILEPLTPDRAGILSLEQELFHAEVDVGGVGVAVDWDSQGAEQGQQVKTRGCAIQGPPGALHQVPDIGAILQAGRHVVVVTTRIRRFFTCRRLWRGGRALRGTWGNRVSVLKITPEFEEFSRGVAAPENIGSI